MPPRFVYWTIIAGDLPTAFRATERDELQPTFQRIKEKHPDAEMKYFAQGKLWDSKEEAQQARQDARGATSGYDRGSSGSDRSRGPSGPPAERRGRDWRPGGEHKDPRQKFIDQKKDRNQRWRAEKHDRKTSFDRSSGASAPPRQEDWKDRPPRDNDRAPQARPWSNKPPQREGGWQRDKPAVPFDRRSGASAPPRQDRNWQDRPPREKPHGDPLRRDVKPAGGPKRPPFKPEWARNQEREERPPREPNQEREPRRSNESPSRPPRPSEPRIPSDPPMRGAGGGASKRPFQKRSGGSGFRPPKPGSRGGGGGGNRGR